MKMQKFTFILVFLIGIVSLNAQTILIEDFEGGSLPTDWAIETQASDGGWLFGTGPGLSSTSFPIPAHTIIAATNDDGCNCNKMTDKLITPYVDLSSYTSLFMSFDIFFLGATYNGDTEEASIEVSIDGGNTWSVIQQLTGNSDWITTTINVSTYAGNANVKFAFVYSDNGGWLYGCAIDNVEIFVPPFSYDMSAESITTKEYLGINSAPFAVDGILKNNGGATITNFDLNYNVDNGTVVSAAITGVNIEPLDEYVFSHPTLWDPGSVGSYEIKVWASNLNGNPDENTVNDTTAKTVNVVDSIAKKTVIIEEFTGAWCGFCPDGAVVIDDIQNDHGHDVIAVAVHDGDAMEISDGIRTAFNVTAYPTGMIDRKLFPGEAKEPHSRNAWPDHVISQLEAFSPCYTHISFTYDALSREINATVTAEFIESASGDMRIIFMVVEDGVTGIGSGYNQSNNYNTVPGHPYYQAGNPIIGYVHNHVLRAIPSGAMGNAGVIPNNVTTNSSYNETFNYTLPAAFNDSKVKLVAFVAYYSTMVGHREVLNAKEVQLVTVGIDDENYSEQVLEIYPNPASFSTMLNYQLNNQSEVTIEIFNIPGDVVYSKNLGNQSAGDHHVQIDTKNLSNGFYILQLGVNEKIVTKKLVVSK